MKYRVTIERPEVKPHVEFADTLRAVRELVGDHLEIALRHGWNTRVAVRHVHAGEVLQVETGGREI